MDHDTCQTYTEYLTAFQKQLELTDSVHIIADDVDFVRHLVITLIDCRLRGVDIRLSYYPKTTDITEPRILELLRGLGCAVQVDTKSSPPPFVGAFFNPLSKTESALLLTVGGFHDKAVWGKIYTAPIDATVIAGFYEFHDKFFPDRNPDVRRPTLVKVDIDTVTARLNTIQVYRDIEFEYTQISPNDILPQKQQIREFKHNQIRLLGRLFDRYKFVRYEPVKVVLPNGGFSLITPPVLEEHGQQLVIAEGHTRLYASRSSTDKVYVLIARKMVTPLPSEAGTWEGVAVTNADTDVDARPERLRYARRIESCVHRTEDWRPPMKF